MFSQCRRRISLYASLAVLTGILAGCDSKKLAVEEPGNSAPDSERQSAVDGPISVFADLVAKSASLDPVLPPATGAVVAGRTLLFTNSEFDQGVEGWSECSGNGENISVVEGAAPGDNHLQIKAGSCFYRSVTVSPGDVLALDCVARVADPSTWAAFGIGLADDGWVTIDEAPASLVSTDEFASYSVRATVPERASYASMWFYSESTALVDNCQLVLEQGEAPVYPLLNSGNLINNADFTSHKDGAPDNWYVGCDGKLNIDEPSGLSLSDGACVAQGLSAKDIEILRGNSYKVSCSAERVQTSSSAQNTKDNDTYYDLILGLNGVENTIEGLSGNGTISFSGKAPDDLSSGFVGLYSSTNNGMSVSFDDCSLRVVPDETLRLLARDLDNDPLTIEAFYDAGQDLTWLVDANITASNLFGVQATSEEFTDGLVSGPTANLVIDAMNQSNYLGQNTWRLPVVQTTGDTACEFPFGEISFGSGCTSREAPRFNTNLIATYGSLSDTNFINLLDSGHWLGSDSNPAQQYFFSFGDEDYLELADCVADDITGCSLAAVWPVLEGQVGVAPRADAIIPVPVLIAQPVEPVIVAPVVDTDWLQPRDLDGDPTLADAYYVAEQNLTWLRFTEAGRYNDFGVDSVRGLLTEDNVTAFIDAMNAAEYLGQSNWRLPVGHGQETLDCEAQGDLTKPECYLEAGYIDHRMKESFGGVAAKFAYWPRKSRWVASNLSDSKLYYYVFGEEPEAALRYCNQSGIDTAESCANKPVWAVHEGDIGIDPNASLGGDVEAQAAIWDSSRPDNYMYSYYGHGVSDFGCDVGNPDEFIVTVENGSIVSVTNIFKDEVGAPEDFLSVDALFDLIRNSQDQMHREPLYNNELGYPESFVIDQSDEFCTDLRVTYAVEICTSGVCF